MLDFLPLLLVVLLVLSWAVFRARHDTDPDRDEPPISEGSAGEDLCSRPVIVTFSTG
jgi:hypothetical protein